MAPVSMSPLETSDFSVSNGDGWQLPLRRVIARDRFDPTLRPIVLVPGYGMNTTIFGFHPRGHSLERSLAQSGREVWSVSMRAQGAARRLTESAPDPSLRRYAGIDFPAALNGALENSDTERSSVDAIGCSLGGSIAYGAMALHRDLPVHAMIGVGSPLTWTDVHPLVSALFSSPMLVGAIPVKGTRQAARVAFPILARIPGALSLYLNAKHVDLGSVQQFTETIEAPDRALNREIAHWIRARDLVIGGVNVADELRSRATPLLLVAGSRDLIVPRATVFSAERSWGNGSVSTMVIGSGDDWYAHADLFIGDRVYDDVFVPMIRWLDEHAN